MQAILKGMRIVEGSAFIAAPPDPHEGADRAGLREHAPVLAIILAHAVTFSTLAILRDHAVWSASVDLGIFKEALWNTLHGRVMYSPTVGYSFLGEHFSPVLFLLVPFYALSPTSECLLIIQTLAVSAAAQMPPIQINGVFPDLTVRADGVGSTTGREADEHLQLGQRFFADVDPVAILDAIDTHRVTNMLVVHASVPVSPSFQRCR